MRPSLVGFAVLIALTGSAAADCTCRLAGASLPHGTVACIRLDGHASLYRCDKALNVSSWRKVSDGCPVSTGPLSPARLTDGPVALAFRLAETGHPARH